jgi:hypothetical protein
MYKVYHPSAGIFKLQVCAIKERRRKKLVKNRRNICRRDFNIAEYLDTKYFTDQFVNIIKC